MDIQRSIYKSSTSAIAELVENSIQANATQIDIYLIERENEAGSFVLSDLYVCDNGSGMDKDELDYALNWRKPVGLSIAAINRFGVGLVWASFSQTKRLDIFSWKCLNNKKVIFRNHIDFDEVIKNNNQIYAKEVDVLDDDLKLLLGKDIPQGESGTIVKWVNANKLSQRTARGLLNQLKIGLGKIFRYFINGEGVEKVTFNIKIYRVEGMNISEDKNLCVYGLKPYDPLFLMENTQLAEICGNEDYNEPTSIEWNPQNNPLIFIENDTTGKEVRRHLISIRFSYFNPEVRGKLRRNPGDTCLGRQYLKKGNTSSYSNISIIRANREIDSGSFDFIIDVSDPSNRWWSIEVKFDPISDEIMGVNNSKQHTYNFRRIDSYEEPFLDGESFEMQVMRHISEFIINNIKEVRLKLREGLKPNLTKNIEPLHIPIKPEK